MTGLRTQAGNGWVRFDVRVAPRSSRTAVTGVQGGVLRVSLTAPPAEGAANTALVALLAKALRVPKRAVCIVRGEHSRDKTLRVDGVHVEQVLALARRGGGRSSS